MEGNRLYNNPLTQEAMIIFRQTWILTTVKYLKGILMTT